MEDSKRQEFSVLLKRWFLDKNNESWFFNSANKLKHKRYLQTLHKNETELIEWIEHYKNEAVEKHLQNYDELLTHYREFVAKNKKELEVIETQLDQIDN
jgi:uncharacterized protein (UPF0305 family)